VEEDRALPVGLFTTTLLTLEAKFREQRDSEVSEKLHSKQQGYI
jgi:hypothetical protein